MKLQDEEKAVAKLCDVTQEVADTARTASATQAVVHLPIQTVRQLLYTIKRLREERTNDHDCGTCGGPDCEGCKVPPDRRRAK